MGNNCLKMTRIWLGKVLLRVAQSFASWPKRKTLFRRMRKPIRRMLKKRLYNLRICWSKKTPSIFGLREQKISGLSPDKTKRKLLNTVKRKKIKAGAQLSSMKPRQLIHNWPELVTPITALQNDRSSSKTSRNCMKKSNIWQVPKISIWGTNNMRLFLKSSRNYSILSIQSNHSSIKSTCMGKLLTRRCSIFTTLWKVFPHPSRSFAVEESIAKMEVYSR